MAFTGVYVMVYNLNYGYANFEYAVSSLTFVFLAAVPVLTMRSIADERHARTDQLLYTLPLSSTQIVLGKYLAMLAVLAVPLALSCAVPPLLSLFGTVWYPTAYATVLAVFLLGAGLIRTRSTARRR